MTWTHREKCNDCSWRGYVSSLEERSPTTKENKEAKKLGYSNKEIEKSKNKKFKCCPQCNSFDIEGYEMDDSHLQGI